jgi:predicted O-methyltransferase YrrM
MASDVPYRRIDEIPGWFRRMDMEMFRLLLDATEEQLGGGDLAELGVYFGKSAALMGRTLQPGETFTVVDLFSAEAQTEDNQSENNEQYPELSQAAFEGYYRAVNEELPVIVRGLSHTIVDHAAHGTHRFVHIDASHLYEHVVDDIAAARTLLKPDGVVVFDDYRTLHAPGVAAAIWQESTRGLTPFAVSMNKLYATFGDADPWFAALQEWLARRSYWRMEVQQVAGRELVRVQRPAPKEEQAAEPVAEPVAPSKTGLLGRLTRR